MESALDPLDLIKHSERIAKLQAPSIDTDALSQNLELIAQEAAHLINSDVHEEFLYTNPYRWWPSRQHKQMQLSKKKHVDHASANSSSSIVTASFSTSSEDSKEEEEQHWSSIKDFEFRQIVRQINEFIHTWELSPATKFVVIGMDKTEQKIPFGKRYFAEVHFSKPTPKCPNPLAVAKVYFQISVSQLLPKFYPVNVIYKFEGHKSKFYAMGERKLTSTKFQRFHIDSILHMKLAFYTKLCECRNPLQTLLAQSPNNGNAAPSVNE